MALSSGSRPLCVPGLGLDARAWLPTLRALAGRRVVDLADAVAPLPAYGVRPHRDEDLDPADLGRRLARERLGDGPPRVLMGHSASCQVVAHAARLAPGRAAALVLVGPTTDTRARSWGPLAGRWLRTAVHETPGQVPMLVHTYSRIGVGWMLLAMEAARHDDLVRTLADVTCPVLVVRGWHDRICPADWAEAVARLGGAGSRAVTLPAGGHMVPLTHGEDVASAVRSLTG